VDGAPSGVAVCASPTDRPVLGDRRPWPSVLSARAPEGDRMPSTLLDDRQITRRLRAALRLDCERAL
jgi:hypothetical protein